MKMATENLGKINGFDFLNMEAQKYWSMPSSYDMNKKKDTVNNIIYSNEYVASEKRDGYWQLVVKDDEKNVFMRARSAGVNGWVCKQDWLPQLSDFFEALPRGTVLVCEVYIPGGTSKTITTILGCTKERAIKRQEDNKYLRLSVFDVLCWHGMALYDKPIVERIKYLEQVRAINHPYVDIVDYWYTPDEIHSHWLEILAAGGEGVVLTRKDNHYEFGKRTARHTLKLKKELNETVDVFLTGRWKEPTKLYTGKDVENWNYWYDELKEERIEGNAMFTRIDNNSLTPVTRLWFYNMAGAVEIAMMINGEPTPVGWISGVSDDIRADIVEHPDKYKGMVLELQAMEIDKTGKVPTFRHARVINWRVDKSWKDCDYIGE